MIFFATENTECTEGGMGTIERGLGGSGGFIRFKGEGLRVRGYALRVRGG